MQLSPNTSQYGQKQKYVCDYSTVSAKKYQPNFFGRESAKNYRKAF